MDYYIFVPREKLRNYTSANHHNQKGWKKIFYYKEYNKLPIPHNLINKKVVDLYRIQELRSDTFYKDHQASSNNKIFDIYKKIKDEYEPLDNIYYAKPTKHNNYKYKDDRGLSVENWKRNHKYIEGKPFYLNFD